MNLPFLVRLVFWSGVTALAVTVTWLSGRLVRACMQTAGLLIRDLSFALLILLIFAPSLWLLTWIIFTANGQVAPSLLTVAPYGSMFSTGLLMIRRRGETDAADVPAVPRLIARLPHGFAGQIYRLSVRDHSVDVVTFQGVFTIRSRFGNAIAEMEPVYGYCTHRSHWVVGSEIAGIQEGAGKIQIMLKNGDLVPVGRKYKPQLEQAGVL